jgi:hypothetical protein
MREVPWAVILAFVLGMGSGCDDDGADADADADIDADIDADADHLACDERCGVLCCEAGQVCVRDACIDEVSCTGGEPCQSDSYCEGGLCVPFGAPFENYDEGCFRDVTPLESFEPEVQCEWPGDFEIEDPSVTNVSIAPVVADLDGDGVPEILFVSYGPYADDWQPTRLRAIRGDTCEEAWTSALSPAPWQALAVADLTGDGLPEVCSRRADGVPYCLHSDGSLFWEGHAADGTPYPVGILEIGISVVNVDGAGGPEVVVGLSVFDGSTGVLSSGRPSPAATEWEEWGLIPALADVDGDGHFEALTGGWIVDLVSDEEPVDWGTSHGQTAVAELSDEHEGPEVVVVSQALGQIRVHGLDGALVYEHAIPGGSGGPPTVADLDGDGQAEFACAGNSFFTAFDLDCAGITSGDCVAEGTSDGILWSQPSHEFSSGFTGSSVFDFEGDGAVEVVYADECWARVYDGATGAVKFSAPHTSLTANEYPLVADVDGDFFSEIVVTDMAYDVGCPVSDPLMPEVTREPGRLYAGITVYRDRQDRWAPSRPLWSQHTEHFYQRNDDGSVPAVELPSWESGRYNSYRQAHPPQDIEAYFIPDLTVGGLVAPDCNSETRQQLLAASVCNRGTLPVAAGVLVSFRLDSPDGAELCAASTTGVLHGGDCEDVECTWEDVPMEETHTVHAVVDPDDDDDVTECHEDNNTAADEVTCPPLIF